MPVEKHLPTPLRDAIPLSLHPAPMKLSKPKRDGL